ncbi:MAG TPA: hypothetical protein VNZ22_19050 [Bacillota bacterium]|nr:hypothetical protein [Bacillota bacterium]
MNGNLTPPTIGTVSVSGGDFVFSGTGGLEGSTYYEFPMRRAGGAGKPAPPVHLEVKRRDAGYPHLRVFAGHLC